jgi:hypothetical protein
MAKTLETRRVEALEKIAAALERYGAPPMLVKPPAPDQWDLRAVPWIDAARPPAPEVTYQPFGLQVLSPTSVVAWKGDIEAAARAGVRLFGLKEVPPILFYTGRGPKAVEEALEWLKLP